MRRNVLSQLRRMLILFSYENVSLALPHRRKVDSEPSKFRFIDLEGTIFVPLSYEPNINSENFFLSRDKMIDFFSLNLTNLSFF